MASDPMNNPEIPLMLLNGIMAGTTATTTTTSSGRPHIGEKTVKTLYIERSGQKAGGGHRKLGINKNNNSQSQCDNGKENYNTINIKSQQLTTVRSRSSSSAKRSCRFLDTVLVAGTMESHPLRAGLGSSLSIVDISNGNGSSVSVGSGGSKTRAWHSETTMQTTTLVSPSSPPFVESTGVVTATAQTPVLLHRRIRAHSAVLDTSSSRHMKEVRDSRRQQGQTQRSGTALGKLYSSNPCISSSYVSLFSNSRLEEALVKIRHESRSRRLDRTVSAPSGGRNANTGLRGDGNHGNHSPKGKRAPSAPATSIFARRPKTMWKFMKEHRKDAVLNVRQHSQKARQLFRWAINMVNMALHYQRAMVEISRDASTLSAVESQWYTLHVSKESQTLVFNPTNFAQNKGLTRIPRWARSLLDTAPSERTLEDCRKIHALLRGLKNFDKFTEKIQIAMCQAFAYHRVQPMRVILRKGHIGHNFYFIYSGSVFVNIEDTDNAGEMFSKTEAVLSKGDSFGEIALLKDVPRTATITCREECELLVVDKEVFSKVCPRIFDIELEEKSQFIKKLALFHPKYWKHEVVRKLSFESLIQEYKTEKVVSQSSAHDEWLYICMEGSCRIVKCLSFTDKESLKRENLGEDEISIEFIENMKNKGIHHSSAGEAGDSNNNNTHQAKHTAHAHNKTTLEGIHVRFSTIAEEAEEDSMSVRKGSFSRRYRPHAVKRSISAQSDGSTRSSANLQSKRDQMLSALDLEYVTAPVMVEENTKKYNTIQRNGNVTLTSLISQKMEGSEGVNEFVYLDIGRLNSGEVFDLAELLVPSDPTTKSSLILVSAGAKLLKLKKSLVLSSMTAEGLEHAKHLARNSLYPTNEVLVNSITETQVWANYKADVLDEAITPYKQLKRHSHAVNRLGGNSTKHHQDQRLIHRLKADTINPDKGMQLVDDFDNPLGDDPDIEEEFESRMLIDATAIHERLKIKPMMPSGVQRRNSFTGSKQYICTSVTT